MGLQQALATPSEQPPTNKEHAKTEHANTSQATTGQTNTRHADTGQAATGQAATRHAATGQTVTREGALRPGVSPLAGLVMVDSRNDPRVQVADLLAAVARRLSRTNYDALLEPLLSPTSLRDPEG
jgi:hypothetical protein